MPNQNTGRSPTSRRQTGRTDLRQAASALVDLISAKPQVLCPVPSICIPLRAPGGLPSRTLSTQKAPASSFVSKTCEAGKIWSWIQMSRNDVEIESCDSTGSEDNASTSPRMHSQKSSAPRVTSAEIDVDGPSGSCERTAPWRHDFLYHCHRRPSAEHKYFETYFVRYRAREA